jgi:hypothetical protein
MLALRRLAGDASLRASLGAAARAWARESASLEGAAARWRQLFQEAAHVTPALRTDLPSHLIDDGSEQARRILREFGEGVDFLERETERETEIAETGMAEGTGSHGETGER